MSPKIGEQVRLLEGTERERRCIVEVTCPAADNPLYRAYSVLRSLGVQIVHAEVRRSNDDMIQRLYLVENDGRALDSRRRKDVVFTLRSTHRQPMEGPIRAPQLSGAA